MNVTWNSRIHRLNNTYKTDIPFTLFHSSAIHTNFFLSILNENHNMPVSVFFRFELVEYSPKAFSMKYINSELNFLRWKQSKISFSPEYGMGSEKPKWKHQNRINISFLDVETEKVIKWNELWSEINNHFLKWHHRRYKKAIIWNLIKYRFARFIN